MAAPTTIDVEQAILDFEQAEEKRRKSPKLFGRNIADIPCFRDSHMYGILSGLGIGLGYFMFTSRVRRATDFAVGSYAAVTATYWFACRYYKSYEKQQILQYRRLIQEAATSTDPSLENMVVMQQMKSPDLTVMPRTSTASS